MQSRLNQAMPWLLAVALLFPLFIQLFGGIYNNVTLVPDSYGFLSKLPLPISTGAAVFGVLFLVKSHLQAVPAIVFLCALVVAMLLSMVFARETLDFESQKLQLATQFLLPIVALTLGQLKRDETDVVPQAFMWSLLLLVCFQLVVGSWRGTLTLTHHLYVFSIYQHFQFVPLIFVVAFCLALASPWDQYRTLLRILVAVMGVYVLANTSFLAIGFYLIFLPLFFLREMSRPKLDRWIVVVPQVAGIGVALGGAALCCSITKKNNNLIGDSNRYLGKFEILAEGKMLVNIRERLGDWQINGHWLTQSPQALLFSHVLPPAREVRTRAHNWYLHLPYNFGLISLVPLLTLVAYTTWLVWNFRVSLPDDVFWLAVIVAFMVLVDSTFKVTPQQPYSGILAYFMWGLLLTRLRGYTTPGLSA